MNGRGPIRGGVVEPLEDCRTLAHRPPQDRVDQPRSTCPAYLRQFDALVDRGMLGHSIQKQKLEQARPQGG